MASYSTQGDRLLWGWRLHRRLSAAALAALLALGALALLVAAPSAQAQLSSLPEGLVADGPVEAIAVSGENVYLGGSFETIGPRTGRGVQFNSSLSERDSSIPQVGGIDSVITTVISDGSGGWYVGGRFSDVGGVPATDLAHILANGTVDTAFRPNPEFEGVEYGIIQHLALAGSTLIVAGQFSKIGGKDRAYLAALSTTTGEATEFNAELNGEASCGVEVDGNYLFVCGDFSGLGPKQGPVGEETQTARDDLAQLNVTTGAATSWNAELYGDIHAMYIAPGGVLYLSFEGTLGIQPKVENRFGERRAVEHYALAALQLAGEPEQQPTVLPFNPQFGTPGFFYEVPVTSFAQIGSTLYVGGRFDSIEIYGEEPNGEITYSEEQHIRVAAFNTASNYAVVPFEPAPNGEVTAMQADEGHLYLAGGFGEVGGQSRHGLAVVNPTSAALEGTDPKVDGTIDAFATNGSALYAGGSIATVGGTTRHHLAVINAITGALEETDPGVEEGNVDALAVDGSTLYVGGSFRDATGEGESDVGRNALAAFSTVNGSLTSFAPEPNGPVKTLAVAGGTLFAGGEFNQLHEVAHGSLAAFSTASGALESFNPEPNGRVAALTVSGSSLYAAGSFSELAGLPGKPSRNDLAAFELPSETLDTSFVPPSFNGSLFAVAANGSTVYAGGDYSEVGGTYQPRLAALNAGDGSLEAWNPDVSDDVDALLLDGSTLYAGGSFDNAGGSEHAGIVGLSTATGAGTPFDPEPDLEVKAIAFGPSQLYLGGNFQDVGGAPQSDFASFAAPTGFEEAAGLPERKGSGSGSSNEGSDEGATALTSTPLTFITEGPPYYTSARQETFKFDSDVEGASFRCSLDGAPPTSCSSPYTTGVLALGPHRFVVQSVSPSGAVDIAGASESFMVGEATAAALAAGVGPVLGDVKVPARIARAASRKRHPAKLAFTFSLSEAATVTISLRRSESFACHKHRHCVRWVAVGSLTVHGNKGANRESFAGTIGKRKLPAGRYRATLVADAAGALSKPVMVAFEITTRR